MRHEIWRQNQNKHSQSFALRRGLRVSGLTDAVDCAFPRVVWIWNAYKETEETSGRHLSTGQYAHHQKISVTLLLLTQTSRISQGGIALPKSIKIRRTQHQKSKLGRSSKCRVFGHRFWDGVALRSTFCITLTTHNLSHTARPNMSVGLSTYNVPYMITAQVKLSQIFTLRSWSDEASCQLWPPSERKEIGKAREDRHACPKDRIQNWVEQRKGAERVLML